MRPVGFKLDSSVAVVKARFGLQAFEFCDVKMPPRHWLRSVFATAVRSSTHIGTMQSFLKHFILDVDEKTTPWGGDSEPQLLLEE